MKEIWKFSSSSLPLLQQCIELAAQDNAANKWQQLFNKTPPVESSDKHETETLIPEIICLEDSQTSVQNVEERFNSEEERNILEIIENNLAENVELIIQELFQPQIIRVVAEKCNLCVIEKLSTAAMGVQNLPEIFLNHFIKLIIPKLLKDSTHHFNIEILTKLFRKCNEDLKNNLLLLLIRTRETNNSIFHDFTQNLDPSEKSKSIIILSEFNLKSEDITFLLPTLLMLYKDCDRKNSILTNILSLLYRFKEELAISKDFGRLLLNLLQTIHAILLEVDSNTSLLNLNINLNYIEAVIETNKSPFRRPCLTLFSKIQMHME